MNIMPVMGFQNNYIYKPQTSTKTLNKNGKNQQLIYSQNNFVNFGISDQRTRKQLKQDLIRELNNGIAEVYLIMAQVNSKKFGEKTKIIESVIEKISKIDFKQMISELIEHNSCGNMESSIGFNYNSDNKPVSVSIINTNQETHEPEMVIVSKEDFIEILKLIKNKCTSNNLGKGNEYNGLYRKYIDSIKN